jgi:hypothetical protein
MIINKNNFMKKQFVILLSMFIIIGACNAQSSQTNGFLGTNINYETGTATLSAINAVLTTLNASGVHPAWQSKYTQGVAVLTGAGQLAYGIYNAGKKISSLDIVNITAGTATIITNSILLYKTFHPKKKATAWNIYFSPSKNNNIEFGFHLVKKIKL